MQFRLCFLLEVTIVGLKFLAQKDRPYRHILAWNSNYNTIDRLAPKVNEQKNYLSICKLVGSCGDSGSGGGGGLDPPSPSELPIVVALTGTENAGS